MTFNLDTYPNAVRSGSHMASRKSKDHFLIPVVEKQDKKQKNNHLYRLSNYLFIIYFLSTSSLFTQKVTWDKETDLHHSKVT